MEKEKKVRVEKGGVGEREQGAGGDSKRWREGKEDDEAEEEFERWKKRKNVIWKKTEGKNGKERECKLNRIVKRVLGRKGRVAKIRQKFSRTEREGEGDSADSG